MTGADYYSLECIFRQGNCFWAGRDYRQALECFLKVAQHSERDDWRRQIAELTGGAFQIKKLAIGKKPLLSPDDKQIVFVSEEEDGCRIFLVDCDGKNMHGLSQFISSDIEFQFTPNGKQLVFISNQSDKSQLYIMNLEGGEKKFLAQYEGTIHSLVFSPDSKRIAFVCGKSPKVTVHFLDIESAEEIELKSRKKSSYAPMFSPDGKRIIFIRYKGKIWKRFFLVIENIETGKHIVIKAPKRVIPSLCCSPDGKYVVFGSTEGLHLFSLDGKVERRASFNQSDRAAWSPSFSRDGKYMVFISRKDTIDGVRLVDVDAMKVNTIFSSKIPLHWVRFLPDDRRIMCAYRQGRFTRRLFLINPDGSGFTSLDTDVPCGSRNVRGQRDVSFSSDGKKIVYAYDQDGDYRRPDQICLMEIEPLNLIGHEEFVLRLKKLLAQEEIAVKKAELTFKPIDKFVKELTEQIAQENLKEYVQRLQDFGPRRSGSNACKKAAEFLYEKFASWGLQVRYDDYKHPRFRMFNSRNVIATLPGKTNPEIVYILSAHYDSHGKSPGIWDDASGVAVVLETARALSKYHLGATLKFICFSGEEMDNIGSTHFVREAKKSSLDIRGMLDIDCIGYQIGDKMEATLFYTSVPLRDLLHSASLFCPDLLTYSSASPERCGILPFAKEFGDITVSIEDYPYLPHPYMHDAGDVIDLLSFPLIAEVAKLNLGALAAMTICPSPVKGIKIEHLGKNRDLLISWQKNSEEDIKGYRLYHGPYSNIFDGMVDVSQTNHYCLEDLPIEVPYFINVRAYNKGGYESWGADEVNINNPLGGF